MQYGRQRFDFLPSRPAARALLAWWAWCQKYPGDIKELVMAKIGRFQGPLCPLNSSNPAFSMPIALYAP